MKRIPVILLSLVLVCIPLMAKTIPQDDPAPKKAHSKSVHDRMAREMAKDPHHVLAMAYHQNVINFARILRNQTARSTTVNVEFARATVAEIRRSSDEMKKHHDEHMKAMSPEMQEKMKTMMEQMAKHETEFNDQLTALEHEVQMPTPDPKKVSSLAGSLLNHVNAMSKMKHGARTAEMKKM
jgi:hypothetical protein